MDRGEKSLTFGAILWRVGTGETDRGPVQEERNGRKAAVGFLVDGGSYSLYGRV